MPQGSIEISTYEAPVAIGAPVEEAVPSWRTRALEYITDRVPAAALGGGLSLLVHAVLFTTVLWAGGAGRAHQPDPRLIGSARTQSSDDTAMQWIVLDMGPSASIEMKPRVAPTLQHVMPVSLQTDLAHIAAELDADFDRERIAGPSSSTARASGDGAELVAMAGRYIGQINARIDRAWMRPRTPIGAPTFSCRVRIDQDRAGSVLNITLERCNGDARWRLSLVQAIESASPLPAPPDPAVFAPTVHMSFEASAYRPGAPEWEYAPKRLAQIVQTASPNEDGQAALDRLAEALKNARPHEVIHLTIIRPSSGSGIERPPAELSGPEPIPHDSGP